MTISPRVRHTLDQYMALTLEVQAQLREHHKHLLTIGWSEPEAWAFCQRAEERILGPAIDLAAVELRTTETVEQRVRAILRSFLEEP